MKSFIILLSLLLFFFNLSAQRKASNRKNTDALYEEARMSAQKGESDKAMELLQKILKLDGSYYMAHFGLADIYHESGKSEYEITELQDGLKLSGDQYPNGFKFLAQALYQKGEYESALKNIEKYRSLEKNLSQEDKRLLESCRFSVDAVKSPVKFQPVNAGETINSAEDEYWPCLNAESDELVFTRLVKLDKDGKKLPLPQEDLFLSKKDSGKWHEAVPLAFPVNTDENEGAQCISADGRLLFFTACGRPDGQGSCDIYMSVLKQDKWSEPVNLGPPVNTNAWESQPSVSADGKFLYFTSNRNGGKGKMDIWRAEKIGTTPEGYPVYGKVFNMENINTPGNEMSPFIHADGQTLYFASDYWPGLGGRDLFVVKNDSISIPRNLGYPINTLDNEEGMIVEVTGEKAWITSNRTGFGGRDLFYFQLPENDRPQPVSYVKGKVIDNKTKKILCPEITLNDLNSGQVVQHIYPVENEGEFLLCLPLGKNYGLNIEKEGYLFCSKNFDLEQKYSLSEPLNLIIGLDPIEPGMKTILNNIFFETDSFSLKPQSIPQLNQIVSFLNKNPSLIIEIGGHTDNTGSEAYNNLLSEKRAASVVRYLSEKGISPGRLVSKGYGFSQPVADNSTEDGRTLNRRTEFKILKINNQKD